jgi:hypothetical protein
VCESITKKNEIGFTAKQRRVKLYLKTARVEWTQGWSIFILTLPMAENIFLSKRTGHPCEDPKGHTVIINDPIVHLIFEPRKNYLKKSSFLKGFQSFGHFY